MRKIAIVGAGQSGLYLAHQLLDRGYDITLLTGQSTEEVRTGAPSVLQFTPPSVLAAERAAGLPVWAEHAPPIDRIRMQVRTPGGDAGFTGRFPGGHTISVDRRLKMADWLEVFKEKGEATRRGRVITHGVTVSDLGYFTQMFDLVVVAVGGGVLGELFDVDPGRQGGAHPRTIVQVYLDGDTVPGAEDGVVEVVAAQPGGALAHGGEVFFAPVLTHAGPGYGLMGLGHPGGPLDAALPRRITDAQGREVARHAIAPEHAVAILMEQVRVWAPQIAERLRGARPIGGRAVLVQQVNPVVRCPVGVLDSGAAVLGMADAVITTGPLSGQTWATSTRGAQAYADRITARGERPFDREFMETAFDAFWEAHGRPAARFSEISHGIFPAHFPALLGAAGAVPEVADRWAAGIDDPRTLTDWMFDAEHAHAYLTRVAAAHR
ncbi:2-polyprenyl-6-methoxyphenol hydroxylase-like FAD-dependent oxidoreductase [Murinocardiopsis flavida]|uniref:2-polyprenyl-6-methoxyphenol hydroxylase-like FAD-dependent oxidoreductase n=1 Tax=Murinocardiopsis flavida TaxID=645275 RepID=A0A2P8DG73_9ACTN|nr:styrene monooxygenase/indole monooxygenase family protein [Murinocardiopsis flavida]PSK96206.1 2-polyprenyl-6-methoxyphenol hydroxylase-like FAD-dependent oxidoreductase [Murinocardiopsis flavida]